MKVGVVGAGGVGSSAAFAIVLREVATEVVLVDKNADLARAQAEDILHAVPFAGHVRVRAGDYPDLDGAGVVVIAAGLAQKPGQSRLELLEKNAQVFESVISGIARHAPETVIVVATNPVDAMTHVATRLAAFPPGRVLGTGTILDTARFRALLAAHLEVAPASVHGYVLGEHGDSELIAWSTADIGTIAVADFAAQAGRPLDDDVRRRIDEGVRHAAQSIIAGKGSTHYGIGAGVARVVQVITGNERAVLTVSMLTPEVEGIRDVALSLPRVVGASGVLHTFTPRLTEHEHAELANSARVLREAAGSIGL